MKIVLRIDDVGWTDDEASPGSTLKKQDKGLQLAQRFHSSLQGLPWLAAVIPSSLDRDGLAWLASSPAGMTVAFHGYNHAYSPDGVPSEYRGMTMDDCRKRIGQSRTVLQGIPVDQLVLPFNRYEPDLAEACFHEHVPWIWGGGSHDETGPSRWPTPPQPYPLGRVGFVPSWASLYGATTRQMGSDDRPLLAAVQSLKDKPGKAVLTMHLPWELACNREFDGVKRLADAIGTRAITAAEYLK